MTTSTQPAVRGEEEAHLHAAQRFIDSTMKELEHLKKDGRYGVSLDMTLRFLDCAESCLFDAHRHRPRKEPCGDEARTR